MRASSNEVRLLRPVAALCLVAGMVAAAADPAHATLPGTNGRILYVSKPGAFDVPGDLNLLNTKTGTVTTICPVATCGALNDFGTDVTADGGTVAFAVAGGLATRRLTGGGVTTINGTLSGDYQPMFTPDARTLLFIDAGFNLLRIPATGGTRHTISAAPAGCVGAAALSPNGRTIAYVNLCGGYYLQTIPRAGGVPHTVTSDLGASGAISFSPDGTRVAMRAPGPCGANYIGIVSVRATNATPSCLATGLANDHAPVWSPDGKKIAVTDAGSNPAILNADGSAGRTTFALPSFLQGTWMRQPQGQATTEPST